MVDNSFEKEMDDFVQDLPLAKIGLQYLKRATNNNILSKITNLGKGRTTSSSGMPSGIVYGEFQDPSLNPAYRLTSENAETALDVNNPDFKLSAALDDPDKRVWTSHELSHLGMALLRKSGLIDNKTYLKYEKARRANDSKLSEDFYRVSKAHLQIKGGEQRALELQGRPFEGESKVRFKNKKGELEVFELPSLDLINDLANTWLEKNANDPSNKSINYGNALKEEVNFLKKEQASKDTARNPEQINYTIDNTMPMIKPSIGESIKKEIREKEEASENPLFLPPQKETDLSTYAKGGDVGEGYATDNYKQFRERNTPVSVKPNTDFINAVPEGLGSLNWGEILEESIPGVGETIIADSLADNIKNKEFKDAAIDGIALAMGVIPFVGDVASKSIRKLKGKKGTLEKPLNFKKAQKNKKKKELQDRVEVDIAERMKIYGQAEQNALNKFTDTFGGFGDLKVGDRIEGVTFGGTKTSHKIKGLTVLPIGGRLEGSEKRIKEYIKRYKTLHKEKIKQGIFPKEPTLIYDETSKITFRPLVQTIRNDGTEGGLYYDMISHKGINKFGIKKYAKGGDTMPMEQQMEMFAVGGLDDDGLSRDPVSGNEIPPGSMANEVRDDVEARLSDGEYVVPANVVRFFGVKFFEDLRTQAMQGLGAMEANGRIGGEPVPSDMPMQDQMAEIQPDVSDEEMQMLQGLMNEGGYVRGYAPGGAVVPKDVDLENPSNYPFNPSPFLTVGGSYFSPNNPNVTPDPNLPPTTMPVTPSPESGISFVTMVNPATGEIQVLQFMGGNPVDANAYNQLLSSGFFIQGSPELAQYKQKQAQDNRESDKQAGGDKPKSVNDLLSGDLYGDMSLGLGAKVLGSVIDKAFPTKSNQNILDYIMDNIDPVTGESRFPPSGRGIPLKDAAGNIVYNAGGTPKFQTDKNGFILRSEGKDGPRNVAKEEVARILDIMKIKKANTDSKGVLNNKAYRDALKKAGHAKGVGLTTKFVDPADWYKTAGGIAAIANVDATAKKIVTDDLEATEKKFTPTYDTKSKTYKYGSDDEDDGFVVTDPKTGKKKDYRFGVVKDPTDLSAFGGSGDDNNNNNDSGGSSGSSSSSSNNNNVSTPSTSYDPDDSGMGAAIAERDNTTSSSGRPQDNSIYDYVGGRAKGGLIKKPTKKKTKKTKKY